MAQRALTPYRLSYTNKTGMVEYEGDLAPPETSYARAQDFTAFGSVQSPDSSTAFTRAPIVARRLRQNGLEYVYSMGGETRPVRLPYPGASSGNVWSSIFQTRLNQLRTWTVNHGWYSAGYPRNLGWTFRTPQIKFNPTNGPTKAAMGPTPVFNRVQLVPRYSTVPRTYPTVASKS